jgi:hypothetical protein
LPAPLDDIAGQVKKNLNSLVSPPNTPAPF